MLLSSTNSFLLLIDMQERLLPAMNEAEAAQKQCSVLLKAAKTMELPVVASEQYSKGFGRTVPPLKSKIGNGPERWLNMQQAYDLWEARHALGREIAKIKTAR